MCDYSLMAVPNRLAVCGEELVGHRFDTGVIGFVSSSEARRLQQSRTKPKGLLEGIWWLLNPPQCRCTAVCIPPGARLLLRNVSDKLRREFGLENEAEEVVFTQTGVGIGFRDAIRIADGREISMQRLNEGVKASVLSMSSAEDTIPALEEDFLRW